MKNHSPSNVITHSGLALAMTLTLASSVFAQSPAPADGSIMAGGMMQRHQKMGNHRQQMMADMKTQDDELTALIAKVSAAPEAQKLDQLVTVVTRMVEQRMARHTSAMAGGMMQRHQNMGNQRQQMMTDMKAQDDELTALIARIKNAPEKQKLDLLVTVVTRMMEQRTARHAAMDTMQDDMMQSMTDDMPMDHDAMSSHPMMNDMDDKATASAEKQK